MRFTLRELVPLAEARRDHDWDRHSHLMALIANVNRRPGTKAFKPRDFHPYAPRPKFSIDAVIAAMVPGYRPDGTKP